MTQKKKFVYKFINNIYILYINMPEIHPAIINGRYHNNDHDNESVVNVYAGKSAYHSALTSGFVGTESEWVLSLHGKTLYLHAVDEGYTGTLAEYLISIQGTNGTNGENGSNGTNGDDGAPGTNGTNGTNGDDGAPGTNGTNGTNGNDGAPGTNGINGTNGTNGINGTVGPQGPQGSAGNDGNDGADSTVVGPEGPQGIQGVQGPADGDSAYTVAVQNGFDGDETAWLASLVGSDGIIGSNGQNGVDGGIGPIGPRGYMGYEGPQGPSNGIVGPQGPAGVVVGLGNLVARLENLETYSPLIVNGNGTVGDITYKNKEEIVFDEQLLNPTITGVGGATPWTPDEIGGMKLWLDASDLTSVPTTWTDKSGQGNIMTHTGSPTLETDANSGLKTIHYNKPPDKVAAASRITGIRTVFWVFNRDAGENMNSILSDTLEAGPFFRDNVAQLWKFNQGLARHESNRAYLNGFRNPTTHGGQTIPHELSVLVVKSNRYTDGFGALGIGETPIDNWFRTGFKGNLGELILFDSYLDDADIAKVEGYLAHKWNLNSDLLLDGISDHPHLTLRPMNEGGVTLANWTKSLGNWDAAQLANGILQGYGTAVSIRQTVATLANEIYEVGITRVDSEEGLTVKLRTSTNVKWLTHNNDITNEVDVPFNTVARFEIIGNDTPTYIELDTVDPLLQITAASLKRKKLAGGVIQELTNNTIKKISGGDSWNAGASSVEFINGQGEGYVQFQMAQSGKDIKVGLTYADLDYGSITPFQIYFTGTVAYAGAYSYYCNYISGDWFRLHHDSVNNQILFKKREADGLYETKHTFPTTTDGSHLYLDTAFKHEGGRINDISMVLGASEGTTQGAIYPWGIGPQGPAGADGAAGPAGGPQGEQGIQGPPGIGQDGADGADGGSSYFIPQTGGLVIAHRGYSGLFAENTLRAFNNAWEQKCDGIEGDFRLTSDNIVVCIHDSTTNRTETTGLNRNVLGSTYDQLNAGNYGEVVGIPTLEQVLDTVPRGGIIQIELKDYSKNMIDAVKVIIDAHDIENNQICIISFEAGTTTTGLRYSKIIMPNIKTLLLKNFGSNTSTTAIENELALVKLIKADGIVVNKTLHFTHDNIYYINRIKDAGLMFGAYTSNTRAESIQLQDLGADMITTDYPNLHHDFVKKKMKTYVVAELNQYHIDGDTTVCTDFPTGASSHLYFLNKSWFRSSDGSVVQSWNINGVTLDFAINGENTVSNSDIPSTYGSNITTTGDGYVVSGTGCPSIALLWKVKGNLPATDVWEFHNGTSFDQAFGVSNKPVAQMDLNAYSGGPNSGTLPPNPTIRFNTTSDTAQVKIVGFRIGDADDRTTSASAWNINIYENDTNGNKVFTMITDALGAGDFQDVVINYIGAAGSDYMLEFDAIFGLPFRGAFYTTAINNLVFHQLQNTTPSGDLVA